MALGLRPSVRQEELSRCRNAGQPDPSAPRSWVKFVQAKNPVWALGAAGESHGSFQDLLTHF